MGKSIYTIILVALTGFLYAQDLPDNLFDEDARSWIKQNYYNGEFSALTYSQARRKMFAYIVNENDTIECVYSGLKQYLEEGDESTAYPAPFNTEHVVPQSLFSSNEPMRSDIYILQPCFEDWNSARSAYPFRELDDNAETDRWYYQLQSTSSVPTQFIERYSELDEMTAWEPREIKKGDVARAVMYFFTMYPQYNINSVIDTSILCRWHEQDTVDAFELQRNSLTEVYQGNVNPYIVNPWWANQAFGCEVEAPPVVNGLNLTELGKMSVYPNPGNGRFNLEVKLELSFPLHIELIDIQGKIHDTGMISSSSSRLEFDVPTGNYYLLIADGQGSSIGYSTISIER